MVRRGGWLDTIWFVELSCIFSFAARRACVKVTPTASPLESNHRLFGPEALAPDQCRQELWQQV